MDSFLQRMEEEGRKENSGRKLEPCHWEHYICLIDYYDTNYQRKLIYSATLYNDG